ncbi:MAG: hypothetical protein ABJE10_00980 [bacterium]
MAATVIMSLAACNNENPTTIPEIAPTPTAAAAAAAVPGAMVSKVTQYGITWTFDTPHQVGQFANGDWWVLGPVTLVSMTPAATGGRNGWDVNPTNYLASPYDSRANDYDKKLLPTLPITLQANSSVVKTISVSPKAATCRPCLQTAAVLTVLGSVPANNGATFFRPPYFGSAKPLYSTQNLRTDLLPSLAPPIGASVPSLTTIQARYQRVQLDHVEEWVGREIHPVDNMPDYGGDISVDNGDAALRFMLNDPASAKIPAMIGYLQQGIDLYHMRLGGESWPADGGHASGRKLPLAFTAVMLGDQGMMNAVSNAPYNTFGEDGQLYRSPVANGGHGMVLWGKRCGEDEYWTQIAIDVGSRDCRDPYGYIDGGGTEIGGGYQACCTTMAWEGAALALHLMPSVNTVWNSDQLLEYMDRWTTFGAWGAPDPCALQDPHTYTGTCVPGSGRVPQKHGTSRDSGYYDSPFARAMWKQYRGLSTPTPPTPADTGKPVASNTGVPIGTSLTVVIGDRTYSVDNQVITDQDIRGFVQITGKNITFKNSIVRGRAVACSKTSGNKSLIWVREDVGASATIQHVELSAIAPNACLDGIWATNTTIVRANIHGVVDGVKAYDNSTIQDSYIHDLSAFAVDPNQTDGTHNDGIQTFVGNQHIRIIHNNLAMTSQNNAAYQLTQDFGKPSTDIHIENNWLDGGGCTLNLSHKGGPTPMTGIYVLNNRFGRNSYYSCPILISLQTVLSQNSGNVWDNTGLPIPAPQRHD